MFYKTKNKEVNMNAVNLLNKELGVPFLLGALLTVRKVFTVDSAIEYLDDQNKSLFNPFLLKDMKKATTRIEEAIHKNERIYVCGDFDVDGITSTAIILRFFNKIGFPVFHLLPKQSDGHGLSESAIKQIDELGGDLVITVDNGSTSYDAVNLANRLGIDVIITDHHDISEHGVPKALAVINPKQEDCKAPFRFLSGGGLALFLVRALAEELGHQDKIENDLFVLAAISTVADVAPLTEDNRRLVKIGLSKIFNSGIIGLNLLLEKSVRDSEQFGARDIAFKIAPVINASGKFGFGENALNFLVETKYLEATQLLEKLLSVNQMRKDLVADILPGLQAQAKECVDRGDSVIVIQGEHRSAVSGLVAAKLTEAFQKPTIVISFADGNPGKASGRSVDGFNLQEAFESLAEYHMGGGGHYMAAGVAIKKEQVDAFQRLINLYAKEKFETKQAKIWDIDGEISAEQLDDKLLRKIIKMDPFGAKNEAPVFKVHGVTFKKNGYAKNSSYTCNLKDKGVRTYNNLEPAMGELPVNKPVNAIIEIVFQEGQPLFLLKDFEIA